MARVGRWMGAVVVESGGEYWIAGNPKEPCALVPDSLAPPFARALPEAVPLSSPLALDDAPCDGLARVVAARLVIARNGSVSERLWRIVTHEDATRAQWLIDLPAHVWEIVRDNVLRCS